MEEWTAECDGQCVVDRCVWVGEVEVVAAVSGEVVQVEGVADTGVRGGEVGSWCRRRGLPGVGGCQRKEALLRLGETGVGQGGPESQRALTSSSSGGVEGACCGPLRVGLWAAVRSCMVRAFLCAVGGRESSSSDW